MEGMWPKQQIVGIFHGMECDRLVIIIKTWEKSKQEGKFCVPYAVLVNAYDIAF